MVKEKMFNENINIAYKIVQQYKNCGIEYEDLKQLALLGLWKASITYKEDKKVAFSSYSYKVIQNEINCFLRKNKKNFFNKHLQDIICENLTVEDTIEDEKDLISELENRIDIEKCIIKLKKHITDKKEKIILEMLLNGEKQKTIANEIGTSQPQISRYIRKIRKKIGGLE